jgi:hypothetical protein
MTAQIPANILETGDKVTLYQKDYNLWVETTVRQIQVGHFEAVDAQLRTYFCKTYIEFFLSRREDTA